MTATDWEAIRQEEKRKMEALEYMAQHPLTHEEAVKQTENLHKAASEPMEAAMMNALNEASEEKDLSPFRFFKSGSEWQRKQDEPLIWRIAEVNFEGGKKSIAKEMFEWLDDKLAQTEASPDFRANKAFAEVIDKLKSLL
jgi:hypothetical protein